MSCVRKTEAPLLFPQSAQSILRRRQELHVVAGMAYRRVAELIGDHTGRQHIEVLCHRVWGLANFERASPFPPDKVPLDARADEPLVFATTRPACGAHDASSFDSCGHLA